MLLVDTTQLIVGGLVVSFALQLVFFTGAFIFKTDKVTDLSYGLTFLLLALFTWWFVPAPSLLLLAAVVMVCAWAVRLAGYLFIRIMVMKKDSRFDGVREKFWSFLSFWLVQAVAVWVIMLPVFEVAGVRTANNISLVSWLGLLAWLVGLAIEAVADWQKFTFKLIPSNKNKWLATGLWKFARHPNYFGEMLCWWGVFLLVAPELTTQGRLIALLSPVFISTLLLFFSGVPPLEKKYAVKFKGNKAFARYKQQTNLLVPVPIKLPIG